MQLAIELTALIATDDGALASLEEAILAQLQFRTIIVSSGSEVIRRVQSRKPALLIIDYTLPDSGGADVCRRVREDPDAAELPIIMIISADDGDETRLSLDAGADSCISRPVQGDLLAAHIKALHRRISIDDHKNHISAGPIDMDLGRWTVKVAGKPVDLTKIEFSLLRALLVAKGRALTRDFLLQNVWEHGAIHGLDTRTVDVHIGRLRRKLGIVGHSIITVRNVGFRFDLLPEWITNYHAS